MMAIYLVLKKLPLKRKAPSYFFKPTFLRKHLDSTVMNLYEVTTDSDSS